MKRINNLYQSVISLENLRKADELARCGKKRSKGVRLHDLNREENIVSLYESLKNKTYKTSAYETFIVREKKERLISRLPYYPDRIVHHAIINICGPIWEKINTKDTHACIPNEGVQGSYRSITRALKDKQHTKYCLKIDIKKFYPSINHAILKEIIRRKIKDNELLWLLDEIVDSAPGLPIGNYTSQYFANLYLSYFDHYVKECLHVKYFDRYADDMVFLSDTKESLKAVLLTVKQYIADNLKLELNNNYQIFPVANNHKDKNGRGVDYVGYVFYHSETRIRKYIKQNLCRKVSKINKTQISYKKYISALCGWLGYVKYTKSDYLLRKVIKPEYYEQIRNKLWKEQSTTNNPKSCKPGEMELTITGGI